MINTNSALYIGLVVACVLDNAPKATIHVVRVHGTRHNDGYMIRGMVKAGSGAEARSVHADHYFTDAETRAASAQHLTDSARIAGDSIGAQLARAT